MSGSTVYGNRISLISKSGIRYTGTLNDVNEQEQTISLEQVRSMGTEGRKGNPLEEIPPSNDVYEYIQFRATDVISVQFENEAPPQPAPPQVPNDPAILDARAQPRSQAAPAPAPAAPAAASAPAPAPVQQQQQPPAQPQAPAPAPAQAPPQSYARTVAPAAEQSAPVQPATAAATATTEEPAGASGQDQTADDQTTGHRRQGGYAPRGGYVQRGGRGGPAHRGGHRRGGYQGRGGYQPRQGGRRIEIPESDFDFESSNSKLNKDDLAKEFAKLSVEVAEPSGAASSSAAGPSSPSAALYVPSKSFFDDISCEAKERIQLQEHGLSSEERRSRLNAERQQNFETFGQATVDQSRYRYNRYHSGGGSYRGGASGNSSYGHGNANPNWRGGRGGGRGGYHRGGYSQHSNSGGYRGSNPGSYVESSAKA